MGIERQVITKPIGDIPIVSFITVHNNIVYLSGVTADPEHLGDIKDQTRQVLDRIDRLLKRAGMDKSKLLNAQVWLTDMANSQITTRSGMNGSITITPQHARAWNHAICGDQGCWWRSWQPQPGRPFTTPLNLTGFRRPS